MGGDDSPENRVLLTVDEHAAAHLELWKLHGKQEDFIAYRALSGQISRSEAKVLAQLEGARKGGLNCKGTPKPPRSAEYLSKQSESHKGILHRQETKEKMSRSRMGVSVGAGKTPWNKGKTGIYSKETIDRLSNAGKTLTGERNPFFGKSHSDLSNQKNRDAHVGKIPWNKGKKGIFSPEKIAQMNESRRKTAERKLQCR